MLTISNKQMEVFSAYMLNSFIKKAETHLRQKFPVSTKLMTVVTLHDIIIKGIAKAAEYNIIERNDILPFTEYMVCLGENFDVDPINNWAFDILNNNKIEGSYKMDLMFSLKPLYPE